MTADPPPRKVFRCRDIGIDCDHVIVGKDEADVLARALDHARTAHDVVGTPHDLVGRARRAIKDG